MLVLALGHLGGVDLPLQIASEPIDLVQRSAQRGAEVLRVEICATVFDARGALTARFAALGSAWRSHGYHPQTSAAARRTGATLKDITPRRAIKALIQPAYMLDSSQPPLEVRKARASHPQAI
jgi:hypothetical protein